MLILTGKAAEKAEKFDQLREQAKKALSLPDPEPLTENEQLDLYKMLTMAKEDKGTRSVLLAFFKTYSLAVVAEKEKEFVLGLEDYATRIICSEENNGN